MAKTKRNTPEEVEAIKDFDRMEKYIRAFAKVEEMIKECLNNLHKYSITQRLL